jgi:hypothetical protein
MTDRRASMEHSLSRESSATVPGPSAVSDARHTLLSSQSRRAARPWRSILERGSGRYTRLCLVGRPLRRPNEEQRTWLSSIPRLGISGCDGAFFARLQIIGQWNQTRCRHIIGECRRLRWSGWGRRERRHYDCGRLFRRTRPRRSGRDQRSRLDKRSRWCGCNRHASRRRRVGWRHGHRFRHTRGHCAVRGCPHGRGA